MPAYVPKPMQLRNPILVRFTDEQLKMIRKQARINQSAPASFIRQLVIEAVANSTKKKAPKNV